MGRECSDSLSPAETALGEVSATSLPGREAPCGGAADDTRPSPLNAPTASDRHRIASKDLRAMRKAVRRTEDTGEGLAADEAVFRPVSARETQPTFGNVGEAASAIARNFSSSDDDIAAASSESRCTRCRSSAHWCTTPGPHQTGTGHTIHARPVLLLTTELITARRTTPAAAASATPASACRCTRCTAGSDAARDSSGDSPLRRRTPSAARAS